MIGRIEAAKDLLTRTSASMEEVAATFGFGTAHALRHLVRARIQVSPSAYRQEFMRLAALGRPESLGPRMPS